MNHSKDRRKTSLTSNYVAHADLPPAYRAEHEARVRTHRARVDAHLGLARPECRDVVTIDGDAVRVWLSKGQWRWTNIDRLDRRRDGRRVDGLRQEGGPRNQNGGPFRSRAAAWRTPGACWAQPEPED